MSARGESDSGPERQAEKPVLVYDDDCGFCTWWAALIVNRAEMEAVGFGALPEAYRNRLPKDYERCVHLLTETRTYSCGAAAEAAFVRMHFLPQSLESPGLIRRNRYYKRLRERAYRWIATHRGRLGRIVSSATIEQ